MSVAEQRIQKLACQWQDFLRAQKIYKHCNSISEHRISGVATETIFSAIGGSAFHISHEIEDDGSRPITDTPRQFELIRQATSHHDAIEFPVVFIDKLPIGKLRYLTVFGLKVIYDRRLSLCI